MAAQASFTYNQGPVSFDPSECGHSFLDADSEEKRALDSDLPVLSSRHENHALVGSFAENVLSSWNEPGNPTCLSAQDESFNFDDFDPYGNGCSTSVDPWCKGLGPDLGLLPPLQNDNQSLSFVLDPHTEDWPAPWGEGLTELLGSNAVPMASGNRYQSTPDLTECSTPASLPTSNSFRDPPISRFGSFDTENQRWDAMLSRSRAADRHFLYGVLTTRIFCRPSCASRRPSRRHAKFFAFPGAIQAAEQAKFRPCKRCKPETLGTGHTGVLAISHVLRRVITEVFERRSETNKANLKLESLAKSAGLSTFHFHRSFKATTQVTPADFITACRALALQDALCKHSRQGTRQGFDTVQLPPDWSERRARKALGGLSPQEYANGARSTSTEFCRISAPVGDLEVTYSREKKIANVDVHAVTLLQNPRSPTGHHFMTSKNSEEHTERLKKCVRELEEKCQDRDVELAADVLAVLWRARVWLKLTHDDVLG